MMTTFIQLKMQGVLSHSLTLGIYFMPLKSLQWSYVLFLIHTQFLPFHQLKQEYTIKERIEYRTLLYCVLNVCGESHTWNANNHSMSQFTCLEMLVYYNVQMYLEIVVE